VWQHARCDIKDQKFDSAYIKGKHLTTQHNDGLRPIVLYQKADFKRYS